MAGFGNEQNLGAMVPLDVQETSGPPGQGEQKSGSLACQVQAVSRAGHAAIRAMWRHVRWKTAGMHLPGPQEECGSEVGVVQVRAPFLLS